MDINYSSSSSQMFFEVGALKNFANFTEKLLRWNFFLIKLKALSQSCPVKFAKFLRISFSTVHLG